MAELTARTNDEGWDTVFAEWLKGSRLDGDDVVLVFSVGGGNEEKGVSVNIVRAVELSRAKGAAIFGVVGSDRGVTARVADACVVIPPLVSERITPHTEGLASVVCHLIVSHPALKSAEAKWESMG